MSGHLNIVGVKVLGRMGLLGVFSILNVVTYSGVLRVGIMEP